MTKKILYQVFPRYFGNSGKNVSNGSIEENGCGKLADFTPTALASIAELGCTHVWYTGVLEHATKTDYSEIGITPDHPAVVKGRAGSPYAIKDYYDIDPDLAVDPVHRLDEFRALVERTHAAGLKVLIDFVPNHVSRQYASDAKPSGIRDFGADDRTQVEFNPNNNYYYLPGMAFEPALDRYAGKEQPYTEFPAKATGNDCFSQSPGVFDWYETVKLNYGIDYLRGGETHFYPVPATWFKMLDILTYWVEMGVDGFRCDMAEMVPVEFWGWVIPRIRRVNPEIVFIAEVYQPHRYWDYLQVGTFDYLYDKEGMYNTLRSVLEGKLPASDLTGCWQAVNAFSGNMLFFLENHDEQRLASDFFVGDPKKAFPAMVVLALMRDNPIMVYAGQELGEKGMYEEGYSGKDGRSTIFDYWSLPSLVAWKNNGAWDEAQLTEEQRLVRGFYKKLFAVCREHEALMEGVFFDLEYANLDNPSFYAYSTYAFLRKCHCEMLLVVANFSSEERVIQVIVPKHAFDCLEIPIGQEIAMVDIWNEVKEVYWWSESQSLTIKVPAHGFRILKCQH
jgi:glycosidase